MMFTPLIVLTLLVLATAEHQCGPNEQWSDCPKCELQCGESDKPCATICGEPKCYCSPDKYRRIPDGRCIRKIQCPQH
uniref:Serine protease inhibitor 2 n=1 Tax=Anisakis simplex TaxID=6269 RepID=ASP2_ANISI|nr:RecName: Full=Serine protease inhibitor 2; AltName: Full=ASPI-2; Flags: Precursor [Anisakis simplex]AAC61298.1 serine protease inhibitor-2 [Anisakis simplex]